MSARKKVAIIGIVGIPAKYGGFETFVEYLTQISGTEFDYSVYCSSKAYPKKQETHNHAKLKYLPLKANGMQSVAYDIISILDSVKYADVLLILGVGGSVILPLLRWFGYKKTVIVNIDGLEWKRNKWTGLSRLWLKFSEACAVKYATHVIGDNKIIVDYVNARYHKPCHLIEYGADHCRQEPINDKALEKFPFLNQKYAFTVCRIEPENNLHIILEAFQGFNKMKCVIVGNWANSEYGKNLQEKYSGDENIFLVDPIYDQRELNMLRSNCFVYIHGHQCGGTNPSLIEAMFLKLSIIAFDVNFNRETTENQAIYFSSAQILQEILNDIDEEKTKAIASKMYEVATRRYSWKRITALYSELFLK